MRISSDYYNYDKSYYTSSLSNARVNTANPDGNDDSNGTLSFPTTRNIGSGRGIMNLSMSGMMRKYSLQAQGDSDISGKMEAMRADMESLKSADVDSMTADEVKETLSKLKADMEGMPPRPDGKANEIQSADLDTMSEADMRDMLKNIQEHAKNMHEMHGGKPPIMGGIDPAQILNGLNGNEDNTDSAETGFNIQDMAMQLVDKLTESYNSSDTSNDDYVSKLKESLAAMFNKQKSSIDELSGAIFDKLDEWNSEEKTSAEAV